MSTPQISEDELANIVLMMMIIMMMTMMMDEDLMK